jgi:hypothetical protein
MFAKLRYQSFELLNSWLMFVELCYLKHLEMVIDWIFVSTRLAITL